MSRNRSVNRREFLRAGAWSGVAGLAALTTSPVASSNGTKPAITQSGKRPRQFEALTSHVGIYRDVINVGLIRQGGKALLIDSGDATVLDAARSLGVTSVEWVLYTHYHRDQCSGASRLKRAGAKIAVPAAEAKLFSDATKFWMSADSRLDGRSDFRPDFLVLRDSVEPDRVLNPGETFTWGGVEIRVVPTPGHTEGSLSYVFEVDGQRMAFTGDLIYGPGHVWEFWTYQQAPPTKKGNWRSGYGGYWAFGGAVPAVKASLDRVSALKPDVLIPSHGVMMREPEAAMNLLKKNLDAATLSHQVLSTWRKAEKPAIPQQAAYLPPLPPVPIPPLPAWLHHLEETSWYLKADDGKVFLFDCSWDPTIFKMISLHDSGAISGVDAIWISHYHNDHVVSVNDFRRQFGAKVYAQKELVDILQYPRAYSMPCLFPESIRVDHALSEGEVIEWKGYKLTAYYFPGQTLYHDGLLVEHDGVRIFLSGDSLHNFGTDDYCIYNRNFLGSHAPGYDRCFRLLLELKPDLMVAAHSGAVPFVQEDVERALDHMQECYAQFQQLFPWDDPNFGLDPRWFRTYPYRQTIFKGRPVTLEARIYNHSGSAQEACAELRPPKGWKAFKAPSIRIPPHTEGSIPLTAVAPQNPARDREVLGVVVHFGDRMLGEVCEAIVDYFEDGSKGV